MPMPSNKNLSQLTSGSRATKRMTFKPITHEQGASLIHKGEHFDSPFQPRTKLPIIHAFHHDLTKHQVILGSSKPTQLAHNIHQVNPDGKTISLMDPINLLSTPGKQPLPSSQPISSPVNHLPHTTTEDENPSNLSCS